ncbi:hypothetical protein NDU88_003613 [Pleurodeles waltl]|uniref:Uncharacterized protein n=1 Tax=Pleurodeles waltl TaxID=8319 RepID=A0AAV7W5W1_PLEWA|nr:hypothetical protein NDU88_003613 [Pleurodeles waltl]
MPRRDLHMCCAAGAQSSSYPGASGCDEVQQGSRRAILVTEPEQEQLGPVVKAHVSSAFSFPELQQHGAVLILGPLGLTG